MKRLKLFFACLLMAVLSIGQVWAADATATIQTTCWGGDAASPYQTDTKNFTDEQGNTWTATGYGVTANTAVIIGKGGANYLQTPEFPGNISSIEVTWFGNVNYYLALQTTTGTELEAKSNVADPGTTATFTVSGEYKQLRLVGRRSSGTSNAQATISKVVVTYDDGQGGGCSSEVDITKGAETNGTYNLSAAKVCADGDGGEITISNITPATGYEFDEITTSASGTVDNELKKVTGIKAATTITVKFKEKTKYTVTWNNSGSTSTSQVYEGAKPEFPATPAACDANSTTFIGWATAPWDGKIANLDDKTVYTSADAMPAVSGVVTYYAVFAEVAGESGWIETAIADLGASDIFVFSDGSYALNNDGGISNAPTANAITVSDGKITSAVADNLKWNLSGNATDGYTFYPNGDSEKWLYCNTTAASSSNNNMRVGTGDRKVFVFDNAGVLVTDDSSVDRYLCRYQTQDFRGYINKTTANTTPVVPKFYKYFAGTASEYMTTCCTKYAVNIAAGIKNGSISADPASACEGTTVTITFSPAGGYHLDSWSVNGTAQDVATSTFSMPAAAVEVSATFAHDDCENLAAPTLNAITKNYNSATIAWNEVTDAEEYAVNVVNHATSASVFAGNVDALSKALENLEPETQYDYTIMAIGDGTAKCADGNGVLEGNFTTDALPTAVLTLMENGNEVAGGSHAITVPFALPTEVSYTCAKTFVGWTSKSDFVDGDEELSSYYEKGAEFTFENTNPVTLYAVYADGGATEEKATVSIADYAAANSWANGTQYNSVTLDENITATASSGTNTGKYYTTGNEWRFYQGESATITIATVVGELSSIKFTYNVDKSGILEDAEDNVVETATAVSASGTSAVYHVANSGTATNGQVRFTAIEVKYLKPGTLSNYSITCAAAPEVIVDPEVINATAEGVAAGVIEAVYDNVNEENVSVALYNDEDCTEAFSGEWLEASINGDKNIAYTIAANTSYNDARVAYIQLTAPAAVAGPAPAVVVIPVSQAKKAPVFASIEELVAADVAANTNVTVTLTDVTIKSIYYYPNTPSEDNRKGLVFDIQKEGQDIKIYYNAKVPTEWVAGGKVSGTLTDCPWKIYSGAWQLAPAGEWAWNNLTYTAPAAIESLEIRGNATKKTYIDGQAFDHAGLTAWAIYSDTHEEEVTALATWTYDPAKLSEGDTEVTVTATYAEQSDDETVTGLTVNPIPNKTIAEFIAAEGTRCYLEGVVSNITNTKYGNFDLTDASGTIYVYGCLNQAGESQKFADLGVSAGDKIKVIAEQYLNHATSGHEAVNVQFVSKVSPVQITIADQTLEEGASWTIEVETDPAAAAANISYDIKNDGSDAFVSLAGNVITANAVGTATIIASIPDGEGYLANSIEFEVEVVEAGSVKEVVILVQFDGKYLAMNDEMEAVEVDYQDGKLLDVSAADQEKIVWTRTIADGKATFTIDGKYLKGSTSTTMTVAEGVTGAYQWTWNEAGYYTTNTSGTIRTFLYQGNSSMFKNFAASNAGKATDGGYSTYAEFVETPVFLNREVVRGSLFDGKWGTICPTKEVKYPTGASFYTLTYKEVQAGVPYKVFFDEIAEGASLVAGKPYLFIAEGEAIKGIKVGADATPGENDYNGFHGVLSDYSLNVSAADEAAYKYYIVYGNQIRLCGEGSFSVPAERAYLEMSAMPTDAVAPMPGRRRVCLTNQAAQTVTGIDALNASEAPVKLIIDGKMYILRGEKMYDTTGRLVK